jgi:protocatechuate 3,4-dioxygenase beta subunit
MNNDDEIVGRLLSRREAVAVLGMAGLALAMPSHAAERSCVVRPQQTEGPYFVDERLKRADIRGGKPGRPVAITLLVSRLTRNGCEPLPDAIVDLWQCDAAGVYSTDETFLRGYQTTGGDGAARFVTVYPGAYPGRTVHVHFKVRAKDQEFTSQLYFDDALTDRVHAEAPYSGRGRRTRNANDGIFRRGGEQLLLDVAETPRIIEAKLSIAMQF